MLFIFCLFIDTAHVYSIDENGIDVELGNTSIKSPKQNDNLFHCHQKKQVITHSKGHKKFHGGKHIGFEVTLVIKPFQYTSFLDATSFHTPLVNNDYDYLFFQEINPPPPKA
jgi:hypothetical protein